MVHCMCLFCVLCAAIKRSALSCSGKDVICFEVAGEAHLVQYARPPLPRLPGE
jgi:hypothetical protein